MKKNVITILICSLIFSCKTKYVKENFEYEEKTPKELWINSYKYEVFYGCIKYGIGSDSLRLILQNKDLFNKSLELDFNTIDNARKLGSQISAKMPFPYIKIDIDDKEIKNKNFISYNCLKYYASRELDSIANVEYTKSISK
jgi:hypothetical protein